MTAWPRPADRRAAGAAWRRRLGGLAMLCGALLLGACAAGRSPAVPPPAELRDRVTASDEPDASKRGRARLELAAAYFGRGQMTTALDQVKLSIQADPASSEAFNLRGLIYANLGDQALAEESFRRALQINPRDAGTMQNLGWYLCRLNRYPEADALFAQALAVPNYQEAARTLLARGVCQANAGQLIEAESTLSRAYELDSSNPETALDLSEVLYRRGEYERARFYVRRVNGLANVSNAHTLWLAAKIENRLGNREGARDFGRQLRNRFPDSREAALAERGAYDE
jgi:type IV pilus assembly protein PilF